METRTGGRTVSGGGECNEGTPRAPNSKRRQNVTTATERELAQAKHAVGTGDKKENTSNKNRQAAGKNSMYLNVGGQCQGKHNTSRMFEIKRSENRPRGHKSETAELRSESC